MDEPVFNAAVCLERVRRNDEAAACELVEHLYPTVIRVVRANLPRRGAEEDLAQEIFLKMFANLEQYHGQAPLEHWVSRIAVNHCLNAIRAQKSRPEWRMADFTEEHAEALEACASPVSSEPQPGEALAAREVVEMLLGALSPEDQLLIQMLELEGKSIRDICAVTGWSATLIRVRAFRARRKLNKRYTSLKNQGRL